jgi:adenylate cyclase
MKTLFQKAFRLTNHKVGALITFFVIILYFLDPLLLKLIELKTLDMKFISRGHLKPGNEVVIAAIDEKSLDELGRWPWPRHNLVTLIDHLSQYNARVIGLDIVFPEPEDSNLKTLQYLEDNLKQGTAGNKDIQDTIGHVKRKVDYDRQLAESIKKANNVILGYFFHMDKEEIKHKKKEEFRRHLKNIIESNYKIIKYRKTTRQPPFYRAYAAESSITLLSQAAKSLGYFNFIPDENGSIRWVPLVIKYQDRLFPPLSLVMLREYTGKNILLKIEDFGVEEIRLGSLKMPVDRFGNMLINFNGKAKTFPHYSVTDIIHNRINPENFKDKIVLVGTTAEGLKDATVTPYDKAFPGIEIHANVIDNILHGKFLVRPDWVTFFDVFIIFLSCIILSFVLPKLKAVYGLCFTALLVLSYFLFSRYIFISQGLWFNLVYPFFNITMVYSGITIYRHMTEEKEKKFIKGAFGQYLSPKVIEQLMEHPDMLRLGGERKVLTVLFSDAAGFTTISEQLEPEELVELLNEYLTEMTDIILKYDGTVDKYEGDAIIAFFGAPISIDDQALKTCRTAIEMQKKLEALREKWKSENKPELFVRIGLNTGPMVVGNMGSRTRMDYTIIGDAVNLASRLEGINKNYNTSIIISEKTFRSAQDAIVARELDIIRVKGKSEPVKIYELIDTKEEIDNQKLKILEIFQTGLEKYRERKWKEALDFFNQVLMLDKNDGPSPVYIQRCEKFIQDPPPDDWDNVFDHITK